jgi:hypothetical protein
MKDTRFIALKERADSLGHNFGWWSKPHHLWTTHCKDCGAQVLLCPAEQTVMLQETYRAGRKGCRENDS